MEDANRNWLDQEIPPEKILPSAFLCFLSAIIVYCVVNFLVFYVAGYVGNKVPFDSVYLPGLLMNTVIFAFPEELIFRFFLITVFGQWIGRAKNIYYLGLCSFVFGLLHINILQSIIAMILGFFLSILYVKCGGLGNRQFEALSLVTLVHAFYNFSIYLFHFSLF